MEPSEEFDCERVRNEKDMNLEDLIKFPGTKG
jgi:hypothetical protein